MYIFAGGGTGGHLIPALAIAEELLRLEPRAQVSFACSDRDIDRRILAPTGYAFVPQPIRPLPRGPRGWWGFLSSWVRAGRLARDMVKDLKPAAVLGLGGFAAAPVTKAASKAGVRTALMSIDAVPGVANRFLAGKVETIFAQFESSRAAYRAHGCKVRVVGCPVRQQLLQADRAEALRFFGLREDRQTLLVVAGSLGAASINRVVAALRVDIDRLAEGWQVLHVSGPGKLEDVQAAYRGSGMTHAVLEFCDRMDLAYAAADLVLCRAGAATAGELMATGRPAVLMPYPYHRDQHQRHNAQALVEAGAARVVRDEIDPAGNADTLRLSLLELMTEPERLAAMKEAASRLRQPGAAEAIARWMLVKT